MKIFAGVLCLALAGASTAGAATPAEAVLKPIRQMADGFNKGDMASAKATQAADVVIQDDIPPHLWRGPGAFDAWAADLGKTSKAAAWTDEIVTLGKPVEVLVEGDAAYAVMPTTLTYKDHGKPMTEAARIVFSLRREASGWKIAAWSWVGSPPHPAAAHGKAR